MSLFTLPGVLSGTFVWSPSAVWNILISTLLLASTYHAWQRWDSITQSGLEEGAVDAVEPEAGTLRHGDNPSEVAAMTSGDMDGNTSDTILRQEKSRIGNCDNACTPAASTPKRELASADYTVG
ncbi:hypothetical protein MANI_024466 [Metarhizium anisopliae]|nr:hypothetical protein MANI_024466 [Metarhizium anisopliae]